MAPPTTGGAPGRRGRSAATSTGPCPPRRAGRRRRPERAAGLALRDPRSPRSVHFLQACGRGVNGCTGAFQALGAGSSPVARFARIHSHGEWRSLVAHPAGGRAVAGSNPVSPTQGKGPLLRAFRVERGKVTKRLRGTNGEQSRWRVNEGSGASGYQRVLEMSYNPPPMLPEAHGAPGARWRFGRTRRGFPLIQALSAIST